MISPALLMGDAHTGEQEVAGKRVCSLLPARAFVLAARSLLFVTQDSPIHILVFVS
jgi:hypothetical protein